MTSPPVTQSLSPSALRALEEALRAFARAFRAFQLYLPNNPTRAKSIEDARQAFRDLWTHVPSVSLTITETALLHDGEEVLQDEERGQSGLPWLLYRDGLRRLDFLQDFELAELDAFLEILHKSKTAPPDEDDLVTILWVADLKLLRYRNVELLAEYDEVAEEQEDGGEAEAKVMPGSQLVEFDPPGEGPPPAQIINPDEFESALYFLDANEVSYLQEEVRREYETDGRQQVIDALFDIIETQDEVDSQIEATEIIDRLIVEALAASEYNQVAHTLREAAATLSRRPDIHPAVHAALSALPVRLSEPDVINQVLQTIDMGDNQTLMPLLDELFAELRPTAMVPLLTWLATALPSPARTSIERATTRMAQRNVSELVRLLEDQDTRVVKGAVAIAKVVASPAAVPALTRLLTTADVSVRTEVVAALAGTNSPRALQVLERAIDDELREVRVSALKALSSRRYAPALPRLHAAIQQKQLRNADLSEKMAFFEAYGSLCGEQGVATLDGILNARGLMGYKESPEMRACAAHALGLIGTDKSRQSLERAADAKEVVVRSAVSRAMRGAAE